jgi:hypothetical protein
MYHIQFTHTGYLTLGKRKYAITEILSHPVTGDPLILGLERENIKYSLTVYENSKHVALLLYHHTDETTVPVFMANSKGERKIVEALLLGEIVEEITGIKRNV